MSKMTLPVFQEPTKLILLISSFAYANVVKLGHDLTMELFWKDDKWNYQIIVKGIDYHQKVVTKIYNTADTIADMSNLRGRATRIQSHQIRSTNS